MAACACQLDPFVGSETRGPILDAEIVRPAIGAGGFAERRVVQHGAGPRLGDEAGQEARRASEILPIENGDRCVPMVGDQAGVAARLALRPLTRGMLRAS